MLIVNVDYQSELPELGGSNCSMLAAIPVACPC